MPFESMLQGLEAWRLTAEDKFQYLVQLYTSAPYSAYASHRVYFEGLPENDKLDPPPPRHAHWLFPKDGVTCNTHVNFFLGYWFNYNERFSSDAVETEMACLTLLDSGNGPFLWNTKNRKDRGYKEFMTPVTGPDVNVPFAATPFRGFQGSKKPIQRTTAQQSFDRSPCYLRISQFFDWDGNPRPGFDKLIEALGDFNVYSVADLDGGTSKVGKDGGPTRAENDAAKQDSKDRVRRAIEEAVNADKSIKDADKQKEIEKRLASSEEDVEKDFKNTWTDPWASMGRKLRVVRLVRDFLATRYTNPRYANYLAVTKAHPKPVAPKKFLKDLTFGEIKGLGVSDDVLWHVVWNLSEDDKDEATLLEKLQNYLNLGHHGGILLKRNATGGPVTGEAKETVQLWKFAADSDVGPERWTTNSKGERIKKPLVKWFRNYQGSWVSDSVKFDCFHLAFWRLKDLAPGGFVLQDPQDEELKAAHRANIDLNNPPRPAVARASW